jgi:ABC-type spermidine/putrescine transport system permease subunit II
VAGGTVFDRTEIRMSWQRTLILAAVSLLLSTIVTGLVAFIVNHMLWD